MYSSTLGMFSPKYWTRSSLKKMCFEARIQEVCYLKDFMLFSLSLVVYYVFFMQIIVLNCYTTPKVSLTVTRVSVY